MLPTYLSHTRSGPNVVRKFFLKKEFLKKISFLKWSFFLGDCDRAFQKSYLCTSLIEDQVRTWFEKKFWKNLLFWNKVSFWVIVTEPLKSLATYLFHRGSSPNIIRKKKKKSFEKMKFWKFWNEASFWVIVIGPLKRLPTYLSHRGSGPNVVRKKFWNMIFFFF